MLYLLLFLFILSQTNREYGLPVFDLEQAMNKGKKDIADLTVKIRKVQSCHKSNQ